MIGHRPNKNTSHLPISMPIERVNSLRLFKSCLEWCLIKLSRMTPSRQETYNTEEVHRLTRKVCEITFRVTMISYLTIHWLLSVFLCLRAVHALMNPASAIFQEKVVGWCKHVHSDTLHRITVSKNRIVVNNNRHQLSHCLLNNQHQKDRWRKLSKSNAQRII